jgi:hypothetical protein
MDRKLHDQWPSQDARQMLLPSTSPLRISPKHKETEDDSPDMDSSFQQLQRPPELNSAWQSFLAEVHSRQTNGIDGPVNPIAIPVALSPVAAFPAPSPLHAAARDVDLHHAVPESSRRDDAWNAPHSMVHESTREDEKCGDGRDAADELGAQQQQRLKVAAALEAVALMDDLLDDLDQRSRAIASDRMRLKAEFRSREREASVRKEQSRVMRLQRAMRGEAPPDVVGPKVRASSSSSGFAAGSSAPTTRLNALSAQPRPLSSDSAVNNRRDATDASSVAADSTASSLLSSLGSGWATGSAIRLRAQLRRGGGAAARNGRVPLQPASGLGTSTSDKAISDDFVEHSQPRLRKVATPAVVIAVTVAADQADGDSAGSLQVRSSFEQSPSPLPGAPRATNHTEALLHLVPSSAPGAQRRLSTAESTGVTACSPAPSSAVSSSQLSVTASSRLPHGSGMSAAGAESKMLSRSYVAAPSLKLRRGDGDAGSIAPPASVSSFAAGQGGISRPPPRDFVRHNIEVAATFAPTRHLAPAEEARLRALLGEDEPGISSVTSARGAPETSEPVSAQVAPDDRSGFEPGEWERERWVDVRGSSVNSGVYAAGLPPPPSPSLSRSFCRAEWLQ